MLELARQAECLAPSDPAVALRIGRAYRALGQTQSALPYLAVAARAQPVSGLLTEFADALAESGDVAGTAAIGSQLLQIADDDPSEHVRHARRLLRAGGLDETLAATAEATARGITRGDLRKVRANALRRKGEALHAQGHFSDACTLFRESLDTVDDWATWLDLGVALRSLSRPEDAVIAYREALARHDHPRIHGNLGNALALIGETAEAEGELRQAVAAAPEEATYAYNLGALLTENGRPDEALPFLDKALALRPDDPDSLTNKGVALVALGRVQDAIPCYRKAIARRPYSAEAHYDLAWALLLDGDLDDGWSEYEWRWRLPRFSTPRRSLDRPEWDGKPIDGTLLLHAEQGLGDVLWMLRYVPWARARCRRLILLCPRPLMPLLQDAPDLDDVIADDSDDAGRDFDVHLPLMSLPRLAGTNEGVSVTSYLSAPPRPLCGPSPHVGLVWAGNPDNKLDKDRSVPVSLLRPLIEAPGLTIHNLQVGPGRRALDAVPDLAARMVDHLRELTDFQATASILTSLDAVVCVDTAVAHLAGALGCKGFVLLPLSPGLPWRLTGDTSPWYPSLTLIRQTSRGDWGSVIERTVKEVMTLGPGP